MDYSGSLRKMKTEYNQQTGDINYFFNMDGQAVCNMNELVGQEITLTFAGKINCTHCGKNIRKTYSDGLCYPCLIKLPQADMCILKPEQCHFHKGTCRDEAWGLANCFIPHTLYLARSSNIKIGITRDHQHFTRWVDQGASEAMAIGTFPNRLEVGLAEVAISEKLSDKTNWRKMLTNDITDKNFEDYVEIAKNTLDDEQKKHLLETHQTFQFNYPVNQYPEKVKSFKLDKCRFFSNVLTGIKGQYLIFGNEVINIRSHSGYGITLTTG
jgi:hypothetical protein